LKCLGVERRGRGFKNLETFHPSALNRKDKSYPIQDLENFNQKFLECYCLMMSQGKIAEIMNIDRGTVRRRIAYLRSQYYFKMRYCKRCENLFRFRVIGEKRNSNVCQRCSLWKGLNNGKVYPNQMLSKENDLLRLFFNSPKHWRFEEIRKQVDITKPQLSRWLKVFQKEGIIKRVKEKAKMPYYTHDFHNPRFDIRKKLYAAGMFAQSGLLAHLASLPDAKAVVLFGSFSRSDWYRDSDIDLFIYGSDDGFLQGKYEMKLHRDIQVHLARNQKELKRMDTMLPYILSGNFIKGSMKDIGVEIHAKA